MNNETKKKIEELKKAYEEFEKKLAELKAEESQILNDIIKEVEEKQIKETMQRLEEIKG